jgi:E3 ubiquitin-protein ligase MARCH6
MLIIIATVILYCMVDVCVLVYAPDMPKRLPIRDLVTGLLNGILRAVRYWLHYTLVAFAWLGIVPLTAC